MNVNLGLLLDVPETEVSSAIAVGVKLSLCLKAEETKPTLSTFIVVDVAVVALGTLDQDIDTTTFDEPSQLKFDAVPAPVPNVKLLTVLATGV